MQLLKYKTQWAAQFFAAGELTRRGYLVSLTLGNAPTSDLLVKGQDGALFTVDVKGQSKKNFWLIQPREPDPNHYFILVFLPKISQPPRFFILSCEELMKRREEYKQSVLARGEREYKDALGGINWSTAFDYEDKWDALPK
jgi:hypothetical protein